MKHLKAFAALAAITLPISCFAPATPEGSYENEPRLVGMCTPEYESSKVKVRMLGIHEDDFPAGIVQPDGTVIPACDWIKPI